MNQELKLQEGIERYQETLEQQELAKLHLTRAQEIYWEATLELARLIAASGRHAIVLGNQRFYVVGESNPELVVEEFKDLVLPSKTVEGEKP